MIGDRFRTFVLVALIAGLASSCINRAYIEGTRAFYMQDYEAASTLFREEAEKHDKDFALYSLSIGSTELQRRDYDAAESALLSAVQVMTSTKGDSRGTLSLISAESFKIFKGEPFEKAMAYFYLGIIYYNKGDFENARASFNKALLMDKQSEEGFREDLRLVYLMLGKTFLKLGDTSNAEVAIRKANQEIPSSPYGGQFYDISQMKEANLTILVELGAAPEKYRHGPGAALDGFRAYDYPERAVGFSLGGTILGRGLLGLDLSFEAKHRGSSGKDAVQAAKGVTRDAALITAAATAGKKDNAALTLGALGFALLNQSQADIRQWELLPGEVHVWSGKVTPGTKTLTIDFYGKNNDLLPSYQQLWRNIVVESDAEKVYLFRSGPYKGDGSFLINNAADGG